MWFEMAHSMRALSPFHVALREARRMARHYRHFEEGGTVPTEGRVEDQHNEQEYELPRDIDPMLVALAIDEKLREGQTAPGIGDDPTIRRCYSNAERAGGSWSPVIISFASATEISRRVSGSCTA